MTESWVEGYIALVKRHLVAYGKVELTRIIARDMYPEAETTKEMCKKLAEVFDCTVTYDGVRRDYVLGVKS